MKIANTIAIAIVSVFGLLGCHQGGDSPESGINGATSSEVSGVMPQYDKLALASATTETNKIVRLGLFISYDNETPDEFSPFDQEPAFPVLDGYYGLTQDVATQWQSDFGKQAFDALAGWLVNTANPDASFLKEAQVIEETATKRVWQGKGPSLAKNGPQMDWVITLRVGKAEAIATEIGVSMAKNHITLLNGHFYSYDAALQQVEDDETRPMIPASVSTSIYGPALDAYVAQADAQISRRIVVFNGCGSEEIENLVKAKTNANPSLKAMDLIGMRGRSSYKHFAPQIARLLASLVNGGDFSSVLDAMKFSDIAASSPSFVNQDDFKQIVPVLCQLDGICPEKI